MAGTDGAVPNQDIHPAILEATIYVPRAAATPEWRRILYAAPIECAALGRGRQASAASCE